MVGCSWGSPHSVAPDGALAPSQAQPPSRRVWGTLPATMACASTHRGSATVPPTVPRARTSWLAVRGSPAREVGGGGGLQPDSSWGCGWKRPPRHGHPLSPPQKATSPPVGATGRGDPAPNTPAVRMSVSPSSRYGGCGGRPPLPVPPWGPYGAAPPPPRLSIAPVPQVCDGVPDCGAGGEPPQDEQDCGVWGAWGPWGACTHSCGPGLQQRTRGCHQHRPGVLHRCRGQAAQEQQCFSIACPGEWDCRQGWGVGGWGPARGFGGGPTAGDARGVRGDPMAGVPAGFGGSHGWGYPGELGVPVAGEILGSLWLRLHGEFGGFHGWGCPAGLGVPKGVPNPPPRDTPILPYSILICP